MVLCCSGNIIVQEKTEMQVEVSAVEPTASMQAIENTELTNIASEIRKKPKKIIGQL